ncbi:restriction endonuclease subunit S [Vibrio parahaemolyticus]|uniref:restriction endonuclease subunit S n=1 Tax=Vibrio parahaemolyticus TaxID=670 RepID=UPI00387B9618
MSLLRKVRIKDLGKVFTGSTPLTKDETMWGGGHFFVKPSDLIKGARRVLDTEKKLSDAATKTAKGRLLPAGTTCVVTIGTIGKLCQLDRPSATNQQINSIVVDKEKFDEDYIYYLMSQSIDRVKVVEGGSASGREHVKKSTFEEIELEVLPLTEQVKVSNLVSNYDNLIENNNRRIAILEDMVQSLYREWFVKYRFPCYQDCEFIESEVGLIPEGWEVKVFTDVAKVLGGGTPNTKEPSYWNGEIPFFTPKDAPDNFYVTSTDKYVTELGITKSSTKLYEKDTVFITARGTVGKVVMPSISMAMNQSCYALKAKNDMSQNFLYLMTKNQIAYLKQNTGGSTFDTIVTDTFKTMKIVLPTMELMQEFDKFVVSFFNQMFNLSIRNINLKKQRDMLLPKLLSGSVEL